MKRSYVYFNLQRRVWSERQAGKVIAHPEYVVLKDARFLVGKAGQARVRAEGRKNVHAGVSGINVTDSFQKEYVPEPAPQHRNLYLNRVRKSWVWISYNPYENDTFVTQFGDPVKSADWVVMDASGDHPTVWGRIPR